MLGANSAPDLLLVANVGSTPPIALASMAKPAVAGGALLGLLAVAALRVRRRTRLILAAAVALIGVVGCSGSDSIDLLPDGNVPQIADGAIADTRAEIAGEVQFALTAVNSGDSFVVNGLPVNGPGIVSP